MNENLDSNIETFVIAWTSRTQNAVLQKYGQMLSLDSTHKTCISPESKQCYLYTIVVKCGDTGKGFPVGYMITNANDRYVKIIKIGV